MSGRLANRRAAERLDHWERFVHRWGCNARHEDGSWCSEPVSQVSGGPFSERRLCKAHAAAYKTHDLIVRRILDLPPQVI